MKFSIRPVLAVATAAALTFGLSACGSGADDGSAPKGEAIAKIAPPAGSSWTDTVTVTDMGGYLMGNPDAPLKLVEYASLTCPHCGEFSEKAATPLREKYVDSGVVSWELRNQIHDGMDLTMVMLARCGAPESYHALSDQVWSNLNVLYQGFQERSEAIDAAMKVTDQSKRYSAIADASGLTEFFAARGISKDQAAQCLAKPETAEKIVKDSETQSKELNIQGTPTFILNGSQLDAKSWEQLEPALQQAGAR